MAFKNLLAGIIILIIILVPVLFNILADYIWFLSLALEDVFLTILYTSIALGVAAGGIFLAFSLANIKMTQRGKKSPRPTVLYLLGGFFALIVGLIFSSQWGVVLKYLNAAPFSATDPVFSLNIGFFVFDFPFLTLLFSYSMTVIILTLFLTFLSYLLSQKPPVFTEEFVDEISRTVIDWQALKKKATPHLSFLLGVLFFILAFGFLLGQWGLLLSSTGVIFGAAYTDLNFTLPLLTILSLVSLAIGGGLLANIKWKRWRLPLEGVAALAILLVLGFAVTGAVQAFIVTPDEFNVEKPYIERNIQATTQAYNLQGLKETTFPVSYNLTRDDIHANPGTINNIRLWDFRPLIQTYNQLQLFRTYYKFNDVDIDRYQLNGEYKQVMVSAREMDVDSLAREAQTWVNRHLVYTHGYGLVMNPVDKVSLEGLPEFFIKNIPPESLIPIERNEIYFGEGDLEYVIVRTTTDELDYPTGDENIYTSYEGRDGIPLDSSFTRFLYTVKFQSIEILFSNSIQPDSKLLMNRNIIDRLQAIAPFLKYDSDPYIVLAEGRAFWIIDAYTTSDSYPYSQPFEVGFLQDINYVRNSVKVVIDAYNGDVAFYVIDAEDPVIQTYQKIFPSLFSPFEDMPSSLQEHIRYPEGLFRIQAEIYATYHMKDPRVFYNREDVWVRPEEIYRGSRQELIPYYVIMRLPGEEKEEFILMQPFVPRGKDNMIGWMAARSDAPNYGDLIVFRFSKQELIYGPLQIEARIDQDTDISAQFTLWGQAGSSVLRGNTLVIPIEDSILYIEPIFLEATEKGTLPQLKRVIVAHGNSLTMQPTLEEALDVIFGEARQRPAVPGVTLPPGTPQEVLEQVAALFEQAQSALKEGDLKTYAEFIEQIGDILKQY